jgi:nucleoside-diphosphate-sugar epimerase
MKSSHSDPLANAKILIAGCGDLGIRLAHQLGVFNATQVIGFRRTPLTTAAMPKNFEWLSADLTRTETLQTLPKDITHLVFAAAPGARTPADYQAVYLHGLQQTILACASPKLRRIVFISSSAVYSDQEDRWVDENTPTAPKGFNGEVLCEAEQWLSGYGLSHQIQTISLRLSGIYGPGRNFLLDRLRLGQASAPLGDSHWVNRIHVEDAAAAILHMLSLQNPDSVYIVSDSTPLPMRALYETLAQAVGGPCPPVGPAPAMVGSKRLSNARLVATGFKLKWPDSRDGYAAAIAKPDN